MDCRKGRRLIDAYVAGELGADAAREVAAHLETCAQCRAQAAQYDGAASALRELAEESLTADYGFYRSLSKRLDRVDRARLAKSAPAVRWYFLGSVAAAAAAVLLLAFYVIPNLAYPPESLPPAGNAATVVGADAMSAESAPGRVVTVSNQENGNLLDLTRPGPFDESPFIYFPRQTRPASSYFQPQGYVKLEDYRRLEDRLKKVEARLEALEQGRYSDVSK